MQWPFHLPLIPYCDLKHLLLELMDKVRAYWRLGCREAVADGTTWDTEYKPGWTHCCTGPGRSYLPKFSAEAARQIDWALWLLLSVHVLQVRSRSDWHDTIHYNCRPTVQNKLTSRTSEKGRCLQNVDESWVKFESDRKTVLSGVFLTRAQLLSV